MRSSTQVEVICPEIAHLTSSMLKRISARSVPSLSWCMLHKRSLVESNLVARSNLSNAGCESCLLRLHKDFADCSSLKVP